MMPPDAAASAQLLPDGVQLMGQAQPGSARILTPAALDFVAMLERRFGFTQSMMDFRQ